MKIEMLASFLAPFIVVGGAFALRGWRIVHSCVVEGAGMWR